MMFFFQMMSWNSKQPVFYGCFNWMIQNLYMGNGCFTKHPFINGCLEFQGVLFSFSRDVFWFHVHGLPGVFNRLPFDKSDVSWDLTPPI